MTQVQSPGRARSNERWKHHPFRLTAGQHVYKGGRAAIALGTGKVVAVTEDPGLLVIGSFDREYDATAAERECSIDLGMEIEVEWLDNDPDAPLDATDVGQICYYTDDQTVAAGGDGPIAGRVWEVDTANGLIAVQKLDGALLDGAGGGASGGGIALPAFTANNIDMGTIDETLNGGLFDVSTTGAASTITLPASAADGTKLTFSADGVKNGHTVQYRDETGPTAITTALTALKRHVVIAVKLDGTWRANAYVSP